MYLAQKHNRDKKNSIILVTLLLLFIFSIPFYSFADNNDEFIIHKVTKGDTLWSISKQYNTSLKLILAFNNIKDKDTLSISQIIKIPQDNLPAADYTMHIVKRGETLWSIAQKYNLSVDLILANNNIANSELISIGQEMSIPSHKNAVAKTNIVNQAVIDKKNNNINDNVSQPENAEPIVYTVKAGDNLWDISRKYGVSVEVIIDINNFKDKDFLSLGQKLEIPAIGGGVSDSNQKQEPTIITYTVVKGDTLWSISQRYDVKMISIISASNLKEISRLSIGQKLKLPITNVDIAKAEGYNQETAAEEIIYYVKKGENLWSISREYNVKLEAIIAANSITDASRISAGQQLRIPNVPGARSNIANFIWPVRGRITSPYGIRVISGRRDFHAGIDIGGSTGTNIVAAERGRVSYTGYMRGFGNVIILSHDGGHSTVYGHNSVNLVKKGQYVNRGSVIAKIGRTGNATGSHLHFEIRLNGKPVNPLSYLK
ncbi:LysM peptidoglycan-binding domain-containing protein [Candidatus Atribacteria bacterium 1244-E10-H5-B2]|nr:MAG: LysM peptidoglycan-binding domain-containing protein [Candidatus Atribacteria bacterium 1244-E10-H5-B2]